MKKILLLNLILISGISKAQVDASINVGTINTRICTNVSVSILDVAGAISNFTPSVGIDLLKGNFGVRTQLQNQKFKYSQKNDYALGFAARKIIINPFFTKQLNAIIGYRIGVYTNFKVLNQYFYFPSPPKGGQYYRKNQLFLKGVPLGLSMDLRFKIYKGFGIDIGRNQNITMLKRRLDYYAPEDQGFFSSWNVNATYSLSKKDLKETLKLLRKKE